MTNTEQNKIREHEREAENFIQKLRKVSLTKTEAQDMRDRLVAYTDMHAAAPTASIISYFSSYPRAMVAAILILIILISGTGVSFAAENSLPGQPFYVVKVSVVEPIQGALITNPIDKAKWQNELVSRRLTEASTLAAQNNLGTSTQEYLAQAVTEHVAVAQQDASQLAQSGNNTAALQVQSDLEAKLAANADFLSLATPRLKAAGDATTTVIAVSSMIRAVNLQESKVQMFREAIELALGQSQTASTTATSTLESASTTPAEARIIAYINSQNSARHTEETRILAKNASLLSLLPPASGPDLSTTTSVVASTTISTASTTDTPEITASSSEPDQIEVASSTKPTSRLQKFPLYKLNFGL